MTSVVLPKELSPYILGNCNPKKRILDHILKDVHDPDRLLSEELGFQRVVSHKGHVVEHPSLPEWVIKGRRKDIMVLFCGSDTHIYRVAKRELVQKTIKDLKLTEYTVAKKRLYYHQKTKEWLVLAKKFNLVDTPVLLTANQAREATILCYEAWLEDTAQENFAHTDKSSIALLDLEPIDRQLYLSIKSSGVSLMMPWYLPMVKHLAACNNSRSLEMFCQNDEAKKEIKALQHRKFYQQFFTLIALIAAPIILAAGIFEQSDSTSFSGTVAMAAALTNAIFGLCMMAFIMDARFNNSYVLNNLFKRI